MRRRLQMAFLISFLFTGCGRDEIQLFEPPKPSIHRLKNGMTILFLEEREFPTFNLFLYLPGGSVTDPRGKEGLASVAMQSLREGGTKNRKSHEIDDALEFVGASLETGTTGEYSFVSLETLKKDIDLGLSIMADLMKQPTFNEERFEIIRELMIDDYERRKENPLKLAMYEFPALVYGANSPWGEKATPTSYRTLRRDDLLRFWGQSLIPEETVFAVSGDISEDELIKKFEEAFGDIKKDPDAPPQPEIPEVEKRFARSLWTLPQKNLTQSTIIVGHLGARRTNDDKFALIVANDILGGSGSITSRLGAEIRSIAGKAYFTWSQFGFGRDYGIFRAISQTASQNSRWVLDKTEEILQKMKKNPKITKEELRLAKRGILRSLIFDFESRFDTVRQAALFYTWGYPDDYIVRYQKRIAALTKDDVEKAAGEYFHPDRLTVLVVGNEDALNEELEGLKFQKLEIE